MAEKKEDAENNSHGRHETPAKEKERKHDYEPRHDVETLKKKIEFLEEELVRKDKAIESLKKENDLLFKTAVKRAEDKVKDNEF